jgi:hypothetical protein
MYEDGDDDDDDDDDDGGGGECATADSLFILYSRY